MSSDSAGSKPRMIRCRHWSEELGRFGGWHHHAGPHACDWANHDDECPYWASVGGRPESRGVTDAEVRPISREHAADVQRVMASNAEYSRRVSGNDPSPTAALEVLSALPPAADPSAKVNLGLWDGEELIAFADVILGWPTPSFAHVGLLMTDGGRQRSGLGRRMHDAVLDLVARDPKIQTLRLSIVDTNADRAEPFWARLGYAPTGEAVFYVSGSVDSMARIWTRPADAE